MARTLFHRMAVVGVGLIGGSLGLAAKQVGAVQDVVGIGRSVASLDVARCRGLVDTVTQDLAGGLSGADLVVLALPVGAIPEILPEVRGAVGPDCLVTDVGSVKAPILAAGDVAFPDGRFVAGHPIAGKELSGPAAAHAELFRGANWIFTPSVRTQREAQARIAALCTAVGAHVVIMEPGWHDVVFATVSHLPHLVAYALMDAVLATERGGERVRFSAGGLRDFTRVAGSDPVMWRDIFLMNRGPVLKVLDTYQEKLEQLAAAIRAEDGEALLARLLQARVAREELSHRT